MKNKVKLIILFVVLVTLAAILIAFIYSSIPKKAFLSPICEANYTLYNTSCKVDDTIEFYYIDESDCYSELIIDNEDSQFYAIGNWESNTTIPGFEGSNYLFSYNGSGENKSIWNFTDISPAIYKVYVKYTSHEERASNAPYTVNYVQGSELITLNQSENGGEWVLLEEYSLDAESYLELTNNADNPIVADAVNLTYVRHASSTPPANYTQECDYNNNNIIGNFTDFEQKNINLKVYINGSLAKDAEIFTTERTIEFREGSITRIEFDYDFQEALNMKKINITKQPSSSDVGYLIVKGLKNIEKTLTIDKLNNKSWKVCVKDDEDADISDMTERCTAGGEWPVSCPGILSGFSCSISGNKFVVSSLENSVVKELINISGSINDRTNCTSNWLCSGWSSCSSGSQIRTCVDSNNCSTASPPKPAITQSCTSCDTNWTCTDWSPSSCPKTEIQSRTCTDTNNCGTQANKPSTNQSCTYEESSLFFWIVLSILIVLIVGTAIAIVIIWNKKQKQAQTPQPSLFKIQRPPNSPQRRF